MSAGVVLQQMIIIFILILVGYILYKKKILGDGASSAFSALVVNACNPALLISSSFNRDSSITNDKILWMFLIGAVVFVILIASSFVIPAWLHVEKRQRNQYAMMCIFGNTGFIGIPLIQAVLGSQALIYIVIFNIYYNLLFYSYGFYIAGGEDSRFSFKKLINVGNGSLILAILVFLWQPKLPVLMQSTITYMSNATVFLAMVVIGINLARSNLKPIFTQKKLYGFIVLRLLLVPIFLAVVLRFFVRDDLMYGTVVLLSAVPVGNLSLMHLEEIGEDGTVVSQGIILSTILAIITIPIVTLFT
jgi:hypothetical protein